jgi:hypothetical protein
MKGMCIALIALATVLVSPGPARSDRLGKGNSMLWLGFNGNKTQLVGPTTGSVSEYEDSELGAHFAYHHFTSDEWTVSLSGGTDVGRVQFRPAAAGAPVETYTSRSWNVRVGADRFAFVNDRAAIYAGPGLLYWTGEAEYSGSGDPFIDLKWPRVSQIGINGRIGMYASISHRTALFGHIGQVIARNTASDSRGKNIWFTNHNEGSVGLSYEF